MIHQSPRHLNQVKINEQKMGWECRNKKEEKKEKAYEQEKNVQNRI